MAKLPDAVVPLQLITSNKDRRALEFIIAAILGCEEEMFVVTNADMQRARDYKIVTSINDAGDGLVLIAEPR